MSFKEITSLRKTGRLYEAYQLAQTERSQHPNDGYLKSAFYWVLHDLLKANATYAQRDTFVAYLRELLALDLRSPDDDMLLEKIPFQVAKLLFNAGREKQPQLGTLAQLTSQVLALPIPRPSLGYSVLLKAVVKLGERWPGIGAFLDAWNLDYLRQPDDFAPETLPEGKPTMSLAERVHLAAAKALLTPPTNAEAVRAFLTRLEALIERQPGYRYLPYFKAKCLLALGDHAEALSAFLPFARQRNNEFWVWQIMADLHPTQRLACLARALLCPSPPEFLVKLRPQIVPLLLGARHAAEARAEVDRTLADRQQQGWAIPPEVAAFQQQSWYGAAPEGTNPLGLYRALSRQTDDLLYTDCPLVPAVVTRCDPARKLVFWVADRNTLGNLRWSRKTPLPTPGALLALRLEPAQGAEGSTYWRVLTHTPGQLSPPPDAYREVVGVLNRRNDPKGRAFGLVEGVYVNPELLAMLPPSTTQVSGQAVCQFNPKKNTWGWQALTLKAEN